MATAPQPGAPIPARRLAYGALALATLAAASSSIWIRMSAAEPLAIAFWRLALAVALLGAPLFLGRRGELAAFRPRDLGLAALGGIFLALHFATWVTSLRLTTVASSTVLVSTHPFVVLGLGAWLYGERAPGRALAGVAAAVAGAAMVGWGDFGVGGRALWGDLLAFAGALAAAGYFLVGRSVRQRVPLLPYTVVVYGTAAAVLLAGALALGAPVRGYPSREWWIFLALAVFPTVGGHTVMNWALRHVRAATASVAWLGEPVGATIFAWTLFGELPGPMSLAGGMLILAGILVFVRAAER